MEYHGIKKSVLWGCKGLSHWAQRFPGNEDFRLCAQCLLAEHTGFDRQREAGDKKRSGGGPNSPAVSASRNR